MKKTPIILRSSILGLTVTALALPSLFAATFDDFNGVGTTFAVGTNLGAGGTPGPSVGPDPDNLTNNVLRLLHGVNSQNNHYTYDLSDPGAFDTINAKFDFRITTGSAGLADGFGFILIPTSVYGITGDGPNNLAEEPNVAGAFALGVDVYPGINDISTHWNGSQLTELNPSYAVSFRDNGVYNQIQITLQRVGNATNASVTMINDSLSIFPGTPVKVLETVIPNMLPYENRVHFGGRTGGENMNVFLDNLNVAYSNPFTAVLPAAPTGHLYQDFDSTGTTNYRAVQAALSDMTTFRPGPLIKPAGAGSSGSFLRIVSDTIPGQNNRVVFDHAIDSGASNMTEVLQFDLRFNSTDQPADGLGLLFLRTRDGTTSNFTGDGLDAGVEEPNVANMLGIGFDVFSNDMLTDPAPAVSLHWNGNKLTDVPLPAAFALGQFHRIQVVREPLPTGINVTVSGTPDINGTPGTPVTLIDHFFVADATMYDNRLQFSSRTGGLDADADIDNVVTSQITRAPLANTQNDFSPATGSAWKGYAYATGAAPDARTDGAVNGNYLRLTYDGVAGQINAVAFDKQLDGSVSGKTGIKADVDFRMTSAPTPADGMSLMLIPTITFGNTGPGAASTPGFISEEPNVAGVFGVALDVYEGSRANQLSVHWNGSIVPGGQVNVDPLLLNMVAGIFDHLHLELTEDPAGMLLDLTLINDIFGLPGAPVVVFNDLLIPDMHIYDYRVELAGRTGGLDMDIDIDNLLVQTIPEPGSAALLGLGALFLAQRRRRS
jgi:hypothetical protein